MPTDPGIVDVKLKCDRCSVEAKWLFAGQLMKGDLLAAKVEGYTRGLVWNVVQKKWIIQDRDSEPPYVGIDQMGQPPRLDVWSCAQSNVQ